MQDAAGIEQKSRRPDYQPHCLDIYTNCFGKQSKLATRSFFPGADPEYDLNVRTAVVHIISRSFIEIVTEINHNLLLGSFSVALIANMPSATLSQAPGAPAPWLSPPSTGILLKLFRKAI